MKTIEILIMLKMSLIYPRNSDNFAISELMNIDEKLDGTYSCLNIVLFFFVFQTCRIKETNHGLVDLVHLEEELKVRNRSDKTSV